MLSKGDLRCSIVLYEPKLDCIASHIWQISKLQNLEINVQIVRRQNGTANLTALVTSRKSNVYIDTMGVHKHSGPDGLSVDVYARGKSLELAEILIGTLSKLDGIEEIFCSFVLSPSLIETLSNLEGVETRVINSPDIF